MSSSHNVNRETAIPNTATGVDALARRYEPTVKMSRLDGYWRCQCRACCRSRVRTDGQGCN